MGSDCTPGVGLGTSSPVTPAASLGMYFCLERREGLARLRPLPKVTLLLSGGSQIGTEPFLATRNRSAVWAGRAGSREATELELARGTLPGWGRVCPALDPAHGAEEGEGMTQRRLIWPGSWWPGPSLALGMAPCPGVMIPAFLSSSLLLLITHE